MLEVKHLKKVYGANEALSDISFTCENGRIYGLLGVNGAGKTTTMNIITGYIGATEGTVTINGFDIEREPVKAKAFIGYLPENPPVYPEMKVWEYVRFAAELKGVPKAERDEEVQRVMKKTGIEDVANKLIRNLSKGYKERVGLANAIIGSPEIIILDEPTAGLDPVQIIEIRNLIRELGKEHTVILSSHILSEVSEICDEIIVIVNGKVAKVDTTENMLKGSDKVSIVTATVKGSREQFMKVYEKLEGADKCDIISENADGTVTVEITSAENVDVREQLSFKCAEARMAILKMDIKEENLEEVFIELNRDAGNAETDAESDAADEDAADEDAADAGQDEETATDQDAADQDDETADNHDIDDQHDESDDASEDASDNGKEDK